jgi:hypothetical protein
MVVGQNVMVKLYQNGLTEGLSFFDTGFIAQ